MRFSVEASTRSAQPLSLVSSSVWHLTAARTAWGWAVTPSYSRPSITASDGADIEGVSEPFGLAGRGGGRLRQVGDVDCAVDVKVPDHEGPIAVAPIGQTEPERDDGETEIAEEQPEPLHCRCIEA